MFSFVLLSFLLLHLSKPEMSKHLTIINLLWLVVFFSGEDLVPEPTFEVQEDHETGRGNAVSATLFSAIIAPGPYFITTASAAAAAAARINGGRPQAAASVFLGRGAAGFWYASRFSRVTDATARSSASAPPRHPDPHAACIVPHESARERAVLVWPQLHPHLWPRPHPQSTPRPAPDEHRLHVPLLVMVHTERSASSTIFTDISKDGTDGHQLFHAISLMILKYFKICTYNDSWTYKNIRIFGSCVRTNWSIHYPAQKATVWEP